MELNPKTKPRHPGGEIVQKLMSAKTGEPGEHGLEDVTLHMPILTVEEVELNRRADELSALRETVLEITQNHPLPDLLNTLVERAARTLHASGGSMYLAEPDQHQVRCVVSYNTPKDFRGATLKYGEGAAGLVAETGQPLCIDDYEIWANRASPFTGFNTRPSHSMLSVPMIWQGQVTGVIHVLRDKPFTPRELELLTMFANHAAIAVENTRLFEAQRQELRERKLVENALRENEKFSRELSETALHQAQELALLAKVRAAIASSLDMPLLMKGVVESIVEVYGYTHVSVCMLKGNELILQHQIGYRNINARIGIDEGISGQVVRTGQPVLIEDVRRNPDFLKTDENLVSAITVPLLENGQVVGTLSVESVTRLTESDLRVMATLSVDVGVAIERARLYEDVQRRNRTLSALQESTLAIMGKLGLSEALQAILTQAAQLIGTSHGYIYRLQVDGSMKVTTGMGIYPKYIGFTIEPGEGLAGRVWQTEQPLIINDYSHWAGRSPKFEGSPFYAVIGIPLLHNSRVVGVLGLSHLEPGIVFTDDDVNLLSRFAQLASIAIENAALYTQVRQDLVDLQQAEQVLRKSEADFRSIFMQSPLGMGVIDTKTNRFLQVNPRYCEIVGRTSAEMLSLDIKEITHPEDLDLDEAQKQRLLNNEIHQYDFEKRYILPDGSVVWAHLTAVSMWEGPDDPRIHLTMVEDITAKKQSEQALHESEEKYRNLVEYTPAVVYLDDANVSSRSSYISPQVEKMLGYPQSAFVETPTLWHKLIHPEDYERAVASITNTLIDGQAIEEYRMHAKDGREIWVRDTSVLIRDEAGRPKFIQGFLEDITQYKEASDALGKSERRLQAFFNQSLDGFFFCDFEEPVEWFHACDRRETLEHIINTRHFTDVNDAMLKQYGISREKFLSLTTRDVFAHDPEQGRNLRRELFDKGNLHLETFERTSDGSQVWFEGDYVCLYDLQKRITGFFGIQRDITDRKKTEEALRESEERFRSLVENAPEAIVVFDVDQGNFVDLNLNACELFKMDRTELMKRGLIDVSPPFQPDGEPSSKRALERTRQALRGEIPRFEWTHRNALGEDILCEVLLSRLLSATRRLIRGSIIDITDRKRTEQALRESEERYRTLFAGMLDGVYRSTHEGRFVDVNPAMAKMFGYTSREEMLAVDIKQELYFAPDERNSLFLDTGQEKVDEFRMRRKDGSEIWVEDHGRYVHDNEGHVIYHEGILRDITERKHAEDALKRSEVFTKSIVENEPECVKIVEAGGILQYMNPAGLAMIEAEDLEPLIGRSIYPMISSKDRKAFMELTEKVLQGEQGTLQFEIVGIKGRRRWLDTHAVPLYDENGRVTALLGLTRDITERKRAEDALRAAEEKFRSIFEKAAEGIYQSTPQGRFYTVNPAFASMMGYGSPQEMIDSITDIARQLYSDPSRRENFTRLLEKQGNLLGFEYQMRRRDGKLVWVSENAHLVRDAEGNILYYEGILEDITERKHNEQRIDNQLKQLHALNAIDNAINSNFDLRMTLEVLLREVTSQLNVDAACVLLFNKDTHTLDYTAGRGFLSKATQHTKLGVGEGYAGRVILDRKVIHIPDLSLMENRLTEALSLAGEFFSAYIGSPLIAKGQIVGVLEIFQRSPLNPDPDWFDFLSMITDQAAIAIDNTQLFENLQRSNFDLTLAYDATIEGWSRAMDLRDRETEGHTQRVTNLTIKLAQRMGIPDADILHIRRGALLHDIGKMGIPDDILHKPDTLNAEEWDIMRQHTNYAYQMLTPIKYLKPALDIPHYHHEKWNGTGYPQGLAGEQIPIAARIFAVVDVWDALTSKRSYRDAWSREKTIDYIRSESGKHFDPRVVEAFLSLILPD